MAVIWQSILLGRESLSNWMTVSNGYSPKWEESEEFGSEAVDDIKDFAFPKGTHPVFLVSDDAIVGVCLMTFLRRIGKLKHQYRFTDFHIFAHPIEVQEVVDSSDHHVSKWVRENLSQERTVSPGSAKQILNVLSEKDQDFSKIQEQLEEKSRKATPARLSQNEIESQDATELACRFAGVDESWEKESNPSMAFMQPLPGGSEASAIRHDWRAFNDWIEENAPTLDMTAYRDPLDPNHHICIWYADKENAERITGTDLIYCQHDGNNWTDLVMIQYKRLDEEERYRIDSQALKEIRRMEELEESLTSEPDSEYRFNDSPFFFKFVDTNRRPPQNNQLVPGHYVPLGIVKRYIGSEAYKKRGGKTLHKGSFAHLTNDTMIALMTDHWIGTTKMGSRSLLSLISQSRRKGRTPVIAANMLSATHQ